MSYRFDKDGFMDYLKNEFGEFESSFLCGTVRNLIDFGLKHHHNAYDQFCYFLSDILPQVEFGDVAMYMDDSCLSRQGIRLKNDALAKQGQEIDGDEVLDDLISSALNFSRKDLISDNPREYDRIKWPTR